MNGLSPEQLVEVAHTLTFGVLLCCWFGWWAGALCAQLSRDGVLLFLRRSRRWRRFGRAVRKVLP